MKLRRIYKDRTGYRVKFIYPMDIRAYENQIYSKRFDKSDYNDSMLETRKAAIKHRDELEQHWNMRINDHVGISRVIRYFKTSSVPRCYWRADWQEGMKGNRVSRSKAFRFEFNDSRSERDAKTKAWNLRNKMHNLHKID